MIPLVIAGIGTANPPHRISSADAAGIAQQFSCETPAQRRLFLLMPLFMLIFFLSAPSGLVLYWLTNNVLTIVQQAVYNRFWKQEGAK